MCLAASIDPEKFKLPYKPEVLLACRRNLFLGGCDYEVTAEALRGYKYIVAFSINLDEMSDFADLVLPETVYLEKLHIIPNRLTWSHTAQTGYFYWGVRQPVAAPVGEARDWTDVLMELKQYRKPVYITENGIADTKDAKRAKFIRDHLYWVNRAINDKIDVRGYFYWSLLDNFEWERGFGPRFGLVEINFKTMERKIRPSAYEYKKICETNSVLEIRN